MSWYDWDFYPPSRPRQAKGGIKSQSRKGAFGETWWAKRWLSVLESFQLGSRLTRGRSYARKGQVLSIEIEKGIVRASVQGSRPTPYRVEISLKPLIAADWKRIAHAFSRQAVFLAKLLSGEMPQEAEAVFKETGVSLFPLRSQDLQTNCSCPDWSNPCKHVAAVYYLLGEEFDRDPFLLFRLRGITREELLALLGQEKPAAKKRLPPEEKKEALETGEKFWKQGAALAELIGEASAPPVNAAIVKRLGRFPLWRGEKPIADRLEPYYRESSAFGLNLVTGKMTGEERR